MYHNINCTVKRTVLIMSLLVLGLVQAQPTREQRQLKSVAQAATEAEAKMVANVTPTAGGMGLPMNQMALNAAAAGMQFPRYPNYPGLMYQAGGFGQAPTGLGLGFAPINNFAGYPEAGFPGVQAGFAPPSFMYGNPIYGNPQVPQGFAAQQPFNNFAQLNNVINMANLQGLTGAAPNGLYPQLPVGSPLPGLYAPPSAGYLEGMNMQAYAPAF